jgi:hypothetical protein
MEVLEWKKIRLFIFASAVQQLPPGFGPFGEADTRRASRAHIFIEAAVYLQRLTSAITPRWEERNMLMLVLAVLFAA